VFRSLAVNNVILFVQYGMSGLVSLLLIPHIVRAIGLAAYGELAIAVAWGTYAAVVVQYAFPLNGPKRLAQPRDGETHEEIVSRIASAKAILLGVVALVLLIEAFVIGPSSLSVGQWLILLAFPVGFALNMGWYLQALGRFFSVGVISVVAVLTTLAIGFGFVSQAGKGVNLVAALALVASPLISGVGTLLLGSIALFRKESGKIRWIAPWWELREGWPLFLSQLTSGLYTLSGPIVIGTLLGVEEAGAYSAVERVMNAIIAAAMLTHSAAYPRLASLYKTNPGAYWKMLGAASASYLLFVSLVTVVCTFDWASTQIYLFGAASAAHDRLLRVALVWLVIAFLSPILTSYLTVSGQAAKVLSLNLGVLGLSFLIGIPSVLVFGTWAWIAGLIVAQLPVFATSFQIWKSEFKGV
jgi:O-antigen/teichoic acid export membrane protein